jgi:hypothetical protein
MFVGFAEPVKVCEVPRHTGSGDTVAVDVIE